MARPPKLTTAAAGRICHHTRAGNYADTAAVFAGVTRQTFHNWLRYAAGLTDQDDLRDRRDYQRWTASIEQWLLHLAWNPAQAEDAPQPKAGADYGRADSDAAWLAFFDAVEKARAEAEIRDMALIGGHGRREWQALAWRRERMQPDRYGRRSRLDLSSPTNEPVQVQAAVAAVVFHIPVNGRERVPPAATAVPIPGQEHPGSRLTAPAPRSGLRALTPSPDAARPPRGRQRAG
jgi:hypothetical protein